MVVFDLQRIGGPITMLKYTIAFVLPLLIQQNATLLRFKDLYKNSDSIFSVDNSTYDFIIVGAGSAGCVLANRLTSPPNNYSVLLLEAGGDPPWLSLYPALDIFMSNNPNSDWVYLSNPEKDICLACVHHQISLSRGMSLGGCSNVNFLIYNRGNPKGFDEWAQITKDPGWNYENLLPYFKKSENYHGHYPNSQVHGCGGELWVDKSHFAPGVKYYLGAIKDNHLVEQDINANQTNSFMRMDQTSREGLRCGTYTAFIQPILSRKNLKILRYSEVIKLIFHPIFPTRVIGVEYVRHVEKDKTHKFAFATMEVIVSSGAYNSPKLLLLSGIGPREDLENLSIKVIQDLPVGRNLQDHPTTMFPVVFNTTHTSFIYERDIIMDTFFYSRPPSRFGFLEGNNLLGTGYISSPNNEDISYPDVASFISYIGMSHIISDIFAPLINIRKNEFDSYLDPLKGKDGNFVLVTLMKPQSVGNLTLNGTNPFNQPIINNNFFSDKNQVDLKAVVHGMKFMVDFYEKSQTYQKIGAHLSHNPWPECAKQNLEFKSDEFYECHLREFTFSLWHPTATCKMSHVDDPTAVVDPRLRVIGIQGLRVVDASIMPTITNGNTNAPVIAIAEKASDMIIQDWGGVTKTPGSQASC